MFKPLDYNDEDHKRLLNRIADQEITLFLGAGFSQGATSSYIDSETDHKVPIPQVRELKEILCKTILKTEVTDDALKEICEDCQYENSALYERV